MLTNRPDIFQRIISSSFVFLPFALTICSFLIAVTPPNIVSYGSLKEKKITTFRHTTNYILIKSVLSYYLYLKVLTAADMCRGISEHVYKFRSSSGNKSMSWNIKHSQQSLLLFSASRNPMFMRRPRLNSSFSSGSTKYIAQSSCCLFRKGCMCRRKSFKLSSRFRYGMIKDTFVLDTHSLGWLNPPGWIVKFFNRVFISSQLLFSRSIFIRVS